MPAFCLPLVPSPEMSSYLKPEQLLRRHLAVSSWPQSGHSTSSHFRHTCQHCVQIILQHIALQFHKDKSFPGRAQMQGRRCRCLILDNDPITGGLLQLIVNYCNVTTSIRHQIRILLHLTDGVKQKLQAVHQHICRQRDTDITVISQCRCF